MGQNEPFWRPNSNFSLPPSRRWDDQFQVEGLSYSSNRDDVIALSSNSEDTGSWVSVEQVPDVRYSDGANSYFSSPASSYRDQEFVPPPVQGVNICEYTRDSLSDPQTFLSFGEGASRMPGSIGSVSSRSGDSEYDAASGTYAPPHLSISSFCLFMPKPIHPFSFPDCTSERDEAHNYHPTSNYVGSLHSSVKTIQANLEIQTPMLDLGATQREPGESTTTSSRVDFADVSEPLEPEISGVRHKKVYQCSRCELCLRLLSQRSPWGVRRMVCSGDMPIVSVLSCWHVYHADCLERTTSKPQKHDPPCPLCEKSEGSGQEQWTIRKSIGLPWSMSVGDEGTSRACWQEAGDCAEGDFYTLQRNSVLLRNRSQLRRHMPLKRDSSIEQAGNSKGSGLCSPFVPPEVVGCTSLSRDA